MTDSREQTIQEFIEQMGLLSQAQGLPRIAGRIIGFLITHEGQYSFSKLSEQLKISRSSTSTNTRLLETIGVIQRRTRPGDRQDYFEIKPDAYAFMMSRQIDILKNACQMVKGTQKKLSQAGPEVYPRMNELYTFYSAYISHMESLVRQLHGDGGE